MNESTRQREERIIGYVRSERLFQEAKFGQQDHPSVVKDNDPTLRCNRVGILSEEMAKLKCKERVAAGLLTWSHILIEEVAEAISAENERDRFHELRQVAAVVVAWMENIDRRAEEAQ